MKDKTPKDMAKQAIVAETPNLAKISTIKVVDPKHIQEILKENAVERQWYSSVPPFKSLNAILKAYKAGRLVKVVPTDTYATIMRLRNPKLMSMYAPFLTPNAKALLEEVCTRCHNQIVAEGLDSRIRLAVTSLTRTTTYQATLIAAGRLADPESAHMRGEVFDVDASGYYLSDTPVHPRKSLDSSIKQAFKKLGADMVAPEIGDISTYKPRVHQILRGVLVQMAAENKLHFAHEYPNTNNDLYHVCRNPDYKPAD